MDLSKARALFFAESREQCDALEAALLDRDAHPASLDTFNLLFRTAHTIKGSAGVFGLEALVRFAHVMEDVLERLRSGHIPLDNDLVTLLLQCNDHLRVLLDAGEHDESQADTDLPQGAPLLARLGSYRSSMETPTAAAAAVPSATAGSDATGASAARQQDTSPYWQFSLRFHQDTFRTGFDPLSFVAYLGELGTLRHVEPVWRELPPLAVLDPTECFFGLELALASDADAQRIRGTFEFVEQDSFIGILPPYAPLAAYQALAQQLCDTKGEAVAAQTARWLARKALTPDQVARVLQGPQACIAVPVPAATTPEVEPVATPSAATPTNPAPPAKAEASKAGADKTAPSTDTPERVATPRSESQYVRIEAGKLDRLINRVGELVIAASGTTLLTQQRQDAELMESVAVINALVESIRDDALTLRMVPVGDIFGRFPRMVRETAQQLGKEIRLDIKGADTEIDKSMVEKLAEPLMHIVRNALDHGLEMPQRRREAGKSEVGTLTLNAYHDAGAVVIEIRDDGNGMQRDKLLAKAQQRGLIQEGRVLTDQETLQLIFLPGFSTAETVSDLSGRGVGMDVVKRGIEALRGVIEIESVVTVGTVFRLRLPLTLAIIDGFRVEVDDATLVMPLDMMYECVDMPAGAMQQHTKQINVRGEWLPFVSLRSMFGLPPSEEHEYVVIVNFGNHRAGIVVDRLLGEVQAVIKPLGEIFKSLKGISGSTILGNGRPALVLDIPQLIEHALRTERRQAHMQMVSVV